MIDYSKLKKPERAMRVEKLMLAWADPKQVAGALGVSNCVAYRVIAALGYERRYITKDEIDLITKYRVSSSFDSTP